MNVVYAPRALRDLDHISNYLTERSPSVAAAAIAAIKSSIAALTAFPQIGRVVDEARHRRLPVLRYPYLVYYRIDNDDLVILHIRHTSRRPINPATDL